MVQESIVTIKQLCKQYGKHTILKNVSLTIDRGEILGFIGPNGAGKTTLIKIMAGLVKATSGDIEVAGMKLHPKTLKTPPNVGLVLEQNGFIPYFSGFKNLKLLASIRGLISDSAISTTLELVGLNPLDRRRVSQYSMGMRQRLSLAQAIMEKPRLLLLDEPTNGLDTLGIIELRKVLRTVADQGTAIFLASHLLTEVERLCDRVLLVKDGQIDSEFQPLLSVETVIIQLEVTSSQDVERVNQWAALSGVTADWLEDHPHMAMIGSNFSVPQLVRELVKLEVNIEAITPHHQSLESQFINLVKREQ